MTQPQIEATDSLGNSVTIDLAEVLYDVYTDASGGVNYQGLPCPEYADLPDTIKDNWQAVADFVFQLLAISTTDDDYTDDE